MVKRGLGKGFASLIPTDVLDTDFDTTAAEDEKVSDLRLLNVADIVPDPNQPRRIFDPDELNSLAESLREHGVLQPIVVTPKGSKYEVVAGERRLRAAQIAELKQIPAIVRTLSAQHRLEISIIENVQRSDLNPLETATAYLKLRNQFNLSDAEISQRVGKATSTISNMIRLLKLPDDARQALVGGQITEGHARQILSLDGEPKIQSRLLQEILKNKWSVRRAEQFVIGYRNSGSQGVKSLSSARRATRAETDFTRTVAKRLGFKSKAVTQKRTAHGGQLIIRYKDDQEMAKLAKLLGVDNPKE